MSGVGGLGREHGSRINLNGRRGGRSPAQLHSTAPDKVEYLTGFSLLHTTSVTLAYFANLALYIKREGVCPVPANDVAVDSLEDELAQLLDANSPAVDGELGGLGGRSCRGMYWCL